MDQGLERILASSNRCGLTDSALNPWKIGSKSKKRSHLEQNGERIKENPSAYQNQLHEQTSHGLWSISCTSAAASAGLSNKSIRVRRVDMKNARRLRGVKPTENTLTFVQIRSFAGAILVELRSFCCQPPSNAS
jgi:hypothetical protein